MLFLRIYVFVNALRLVLINYKLPKRSVDTDIKLSGEYDFKSTDLPHW